MKKPQEKGFRPVRFCPPQPDDNWPYRNHPDSPDDRQFGNKAPKFERHIFIRKDQVLFDIESQVGMVAMARRKEDGTEDSALSNATTTYKQQFYRWMDKHIGITKNVMQAFTLEKFTTAKMNGIDSQDEVDIELLMPEYWDDTVFQQLVSAIHDYVVNATLFEFFTLTLTSRDPLTADKRALMDEALHNVKILVNAAKPGRIHKHLAPF